MSKAREANRTRRRHAAVALAAIFILMPALGLVAAAPATTTPTSPAPLDLSEAGQDAFEPQVAVDSQGNAVVVWHNLSYPLIIQSAQRPAGGAWSAPLDVSEAGQDVQYQAESPRVAIDAQGNATAVWRRVNGNLVSAERPVGGAWTAPVDLSEPGQEAVHPRVALDAQGNATAVWQLYDGSKNTIQSAQRPAGGTWSAPLDLSEASEDALHPEVAVDPRGNATVVWYRRVDGDYWTMIQSAQRPAGGAWTAPVDLSDEGQAHSPQVTVDPQGRATAVWWRFDGSRSIIESTQRPAGGAWSAPVDLGLGNTQGYPPKVAVDPQGRATAVWEHYDGNTYTIQSAERPAGGAWSVPVVVSNSGDDIGVAVDPEGNATAIWHNMRNGKIQIAERPAGGTWSAPLDLSEAGLTDNPEVAIDPRGNAAAVWQRYDDGNYVIRAIVFDVASGLTLIEPRPWDPTGAEAAAALPAPARGNTFNVELLAGVVRIRESGSKRFHRLRRPEQIPVGSVVDATGGRVGLTSAVRHGRTQSADFYRGAFSVRQPSSGKPRTEIRLIDKRPKSRHRGAKGRHRGRRRQRSEGGGLWGNGHGDYVTRGRHGSATVRGTIWFTQDLPEGTYFRVRRGVVKVRDFTRHRTVKLHAGEDYLAPASR